MRYARRTLEGGQPDVARAYAERALRFVPEEPEAVRIRNEAEAELARRWANFVRSLGAAPVPGDAAVQRPLALALLDGPPRIPATAERLAERRPETMQDDAQLALALGAADAGRERVAWRRIERLGEASPAKSNVARHAEAWWTSADENPYHAFRRANRQVDRRQAAQIALGPLASPRDYDLPKGLRWLGFVPALPAAVFGLPARLLKAPIEPANRRVPALAQRFRPEQIAFDGQSRLTLIADQLSPATAGPVFRPYVSGSYRRSSTQ